MKKHLLTTTLVGFAAIALTACGGKTEESAKNIEEMAAAARTMSDEELLAKAKTESGKFLAYGNTSRIADAMKGFVAKYGTELGLSETTAVGSKLSDSQIYSSLTTEYTSRDNSNGASFVLVQDSATLANYRSQTTMLTNYISDRFAGNVDEGDLVPLAHQFINKLFIWNNTKGEAAPKFKNVWELTEEKFKGKIFFKSPESEQVNLNFLITLTSPTWVSKMEASYKEYFKRDFVKTEELKNASYGWIKAFLENADISSYTSDTKMAAGVSNVTNADKIGLFVLSKLRDKSVTSENLQVGAWTTEGITPFAGFMYSIYAQLASKGPRPYTAMLFTNYLMTEEGFAPWKTAVGGYSSNKSIKEFEGDKPLSFYKQNLVVEDGAYINTVKTTMTDWINGLLKRAN